MRETRSAARTSNGRAVFRYAGPSSASAAAPAVGAAGVAATVAGALSAADNSAAAISAPACLRRRGTGDFIVDPPRSLVSCVRRCGPWPGRNGCGGTRTATDVGTGAPAPAKLVYWLN